MSETFNFDFYQIPSVGVPEPEFDTEVRTETDVPIRRPFNMKVSNFVALEIGPRLSWDTTRVNTMPFKAAGESYDLNVLTEDSGRGHDVQLFGVGVNYNPHLWGDSIHYVRNDQFIRMTMSRNTGTTTEATDIDPPKFDVMDTKERSAEGIEAAANANLKNWPSEGWRSFGGKYDFELPYMGGGPK
jgi:hypothetical protein